MASIADSTAVPTTAPKEDETTNSRTVALSPIQEGPTEEPANVSALPIEQQETVEASSTLKASAEEYLGAEPKTNPEELEELKKAFAVNEEAVEALVSELARKRTELKALEKLTRQGEEYSRVPKSLLTVSEKGLRIVSNTELCVVVDGKAAHVVENTPDRKKFLLNTTCKVYHDNGELLRTTNTGVEEWKTQYQGTDMEETIAVVVQAFHRKETLEIGIESALLEQLKTHVKEQRKKKKSPTECFGGPDAYGIVLRVTSRTTSGQTFLVCLKEQLDTLELVEYLFLHRQQSVKTVEVLCGECYVLPNFRKKTVGKKRGRVAKPLSVKKSHMIKGEIQCSCCNSTTFWTNVSDRLCTYMTKNGPRLLKKIGIPEDIRPQYTVNDGLLETSKLKENETCMNCVVKAICTHLAIDYVKHPEHRQASVLYVLEKLLGLKQSVWTLKNGKVPTKCQPLLPELSKRLASLSVERQKDLYSLTAMYYISRNKCFSKMNEGAYDPWQLDIKNKMRCLVAGHKKPEPIVPKKKKKPEPIVPKKKADDIESESDVDVESEQGPNSTEYDFDALMDTDDDHPKEDDPEEDDPKDRKMTVAEAEADDQQTDQQLEDELLDQAILTDNEEETGQPTAEQTDMEVEAEQPAAEANEQPTDMEVEAEQPAAEANEQPTVEDETATSEVEQPTEADTAETDNTDVPEAAETDKSAEADTAVSTENPTAMEVVEEAKPVTVKVPKWVTNCTEEKVLKWKAVTLRARAKKLDIQVENIHLNELRTLLWEAIEKRKTVNAKC